MTAQKRKRKKSRQAKASFKGKMFEYNFSRWLSDWWGGKFRRTPMSGAWDVSKVFDLMPMDKRAAAFPCGVECKNQKVLQIHMLFGKKHPVFDDWWRQVKRAIKRYKQPLAPMLVMSKSYYPVFIALPFDLPIAPKLLIKVDGESVFIFEQRSFKEKMTPKKFKRIVLRKWLNKSA